MNKIYRVNTKTGAVTSDTLKKDYELFGGRGLIAKLMTDEVNPLCDPLGPENKLIIALGMFAGTSVTTAHRVSVGGKSPLTKGIKEANVGGNFGSSLARHGIKMLVFEDQPADDKWKILKIGKDGKVELVPADDLKGLNNYDLYKKLHKAYGEDISVLSIGTAGERLYKIATLQATDFSSKHPARAAGRGGLGAVAGSKKIKAIVIEKANTKYEVQYADKEKFTVTNKKFADIISNHDSLAGMKAAGTHGVIEITSSQGILPTHNFSGKVITDDNMDKFGAGAYLEAIENNGGKQGLPCQPGCLIQCSNIWHNSKGEYVTAGLEYESTSLLGPNCDIYDLNYVAEADRLCDDIGIDTMEAGNIIAVCMDSGKIPWGDASAAMNLLKEVASGTEFGNLIGQGIVGVGKKLGARRVPAVKGQGLPAYEPRNLKGMGVTYATSTQGADHTAGHTLGADIDHKLKDKQVETSKQMQIVACLIDNMVCLFASAGLLPDPTILPDLLKGLYGVDMDITKAMGIGAKTLMMEQAWNKKANLTEADDRLPDFMYKEAAEQVDGPFDISAEEMQQVNNWQ